MSWTAPANRGDVLFLEPSLRYVYRHLDFTPTLVLADMAYISMAVHKRLREQLHIGVLTALPPNYDLPKKVEPAVLMRCAQGQKLRWLGLRENEHLHWFGVAQEPSPLCPHCWEQSTCPREFSFAPEDHEIALGTIPTHSWLAKKLLRQSRPWIEANQSYEKIQLGLSSMFLNSLRLASIASLLADTVCLLRAHAVLSKPQEPHLLKDLLPSQLILGLE
jgi:hypothetical protein